MPRSGTPWSEFSQTPFGQRIANNATGPHVNELTNPTGTDAPFQWDPETQQFVDLAKAQIGRLSQPFSDPGLDEVVNLIRSQMGGLTSQGPISFGVSNPLLGDFINQGRQRITELNQEPFTADEEARMRARAIGGVEKNRTANLNRAKENISRRGMADTSGLLLELEQDINNAASTDRTTAETDLAMFQTNERNRRRDMATTIAGQLATAGAADAGMNLQAQIASQSANQGKSGQIMAMAGMLAELAAQRRGESRARQNDVLAIAQTLANLAPQRMAQLMTVLNGSPSPESVFGNTLNLNNNINARNDQRSAGGDASMMGLMQLLGYFANRGNN